MSKDKDKKIIEPEIVPYRDSKALAELLSQPKMKIAEAITGAISKGWSGMTVAGCRIVQGALKGNMMQQFSRELSQLIEEGKIKENYAEAKFGFQSLSELLEFIDSEVPDEDRFRAVKSMFYAINSVEISDAEALLSYQLFKLSKELSSSQLLLLKFSYDEFLKKISFAESAVGWIIYMAEKFGHGINELIEKDEKALIELNLISKRTFPDQSGINTNNARLTKLGIKLCENLTQFSGFIEVK